MCSSDLERSSANGQAPKLLEFTPGVDLTQSGLYDFNLNARGFNSTLTRRILTLVDGRDTSTVFTGTQEWSAISFPLDELSRVELVRGPGSALYGANAFSGVLNMTTKPPRGNEGGQIRLAFGELDTRRADFRFAADLGAGYYGKLVGGYTESGDFTASRRIQAEYLPCPAGLTTGCLGRERLDPRLKEDKIAFGGLRLDKYFGDSMVLTVEGGTAEIGGPTVVTGAGRVQITDSARPWARLNVNAPQWNLLSYYNRRKSEDQLSLPSGALLFEDSTKRHAELQGNRAFGRGKGFAVIGLSYHQQETDTANHQGVQTLLARPQSERQEAVFGQVEHSFGNHLKAVVAARADRSTLHDTQISPKGALVWSIHPNHTLRLTYNRAFQQPNISERFLQARTSFPGTTLSALDLSAIETGLAPFLGGVSLGFSGIPVLVLGNEDLEVEKIRSYEAGYHGILGSNAYITIDCYQSEIEDFVTDLLRNVGPGGRTNPDFGPYAPPASLPEPVRRQILEILRTNPATAAVFPFLSNLANGQPIVALASYKNAGRVETHGVDVALHYSFLERWLLDVSYSWFDFDVREQALGDQLLPNAPEHKATAGLSYSHGRTSAAIAYRWVDDFSWAAGSYTGPVPSYGVADLSASYRLSDRWEIGLNVANLFDHEHWQSFGGDLLRRRALGSVAFRW